MFEKGFQVDLTRFFDYFFMIFLYTNRTEFFGAKLALKWFFTYISVMTVVEFYSMAVEIQQIREGMVIS